MRTPLRRMAGLFRKTLALALILEGPAVPFAAATQVESFTPQGAAREVRQVSARFSAPMVAFGDPRLADPFDIQCPQAGSGRWIDDKTWSYDFPGDLPAGMRCRFNLKPDLRDSAGDALSGGRDFSFDTGGPMVLQSLPHAGSERIDENQIFMLGLDAAADPRSIREHVYCQADGINEKIRVQLIEGDQRSQLLAARRDFLVSFGRAYLRDDSLRPDDKRLDALPVALLQCRRALPNSVPVKLVWGAGVASTGGIAGSADQLLSYRVRPDFSASFSCSRAGVDGPCIPILPMALNFTAPIALADARAMTLRAQDGSEIHPDLSDADQKSETLTRVGFKPPFPIDARFTLNIPAGLKDDAGRTLINRARFPLPVNTGELPPLAKFPARFGIVELNGDAALPVTLRNLEAELNGRSMTLPTGAAPARLKGALLRLGAEDRAIMDWFDRLEQAGRPEWDEHGNIKTAPGSRSLFGAHDHTQALQLPKPNGAQAFEVVGIALRQPGFYVVELESPKLGAALLPAGGPMYVQAAALVTNLAAHFKRGAESSLVWVTTLDRAQPVPGADVIVRDCSGAALWQGKTGADGVARIDGALRERRCEQRGDDYFISARSGADMTFTRSSWTGGIQPWRFNLPTGSWRRDNTIAHTVFDRTLLMAGDTLHMKHFLRAHHQAGLGLPAARPEKMTIRHDGSGQEYELPLNWNSAGSAENSWKVPPDARQGGYSVLLGGREAGTFRVESFRVPTMKVILQGPKNPVVQAHSVPLDIQVNYLAGGGAANAPLKLRSVLENKVVEFADYADYTFANGAVKEGVVGDAPAPDEDDGVFYGAEGEGGGQGPVRTQVLTLDRAGAARAAIDRLPKLDAPRQLRAEVEYRDANGETLISSTRIALWPAQRVIGIKPDGWAALRDDFKLQAVVLDLNGRPVADAQVSVDFFQRNYYSHRRRLIGGFYAYEHNREIKRLGAACSGRTDAHGILSCAVKAPAGGNLIVQARTADAQGNGAVAHQDVWVAGADALWFDAQDNDRMDVLPEQKRYEPGATAALQVRMPFREATALVTVEREGILDTYVQTLSGSDPVVRVPVKENYAPNVYVSVFVVRGRVAGVQPGALVDLGRPAYRMGIAELQVGWRAHALNVSVAADKPVYNVRDKARVRIRVRRADGAAPAGGEVALAAVDEGLLELMPNASWNLLDAMMQRRPIEVETATAQMEVIGRRHFGRKAVTHGGGGGKSAARELFDAMLFWRARVELDARGEASVEVPLNDALTTFRIVAVASAGADSFGTGGAQIRTSQDLILVSGVPALVREGDRFRAGFTVRNTTQRALDIELGGHWRAQTAAGEQAAQHLGAQRLRVEANQAREIGWDIQAPAGARALTWEVFAQPQKTEGAASAGDRVRVRQSVAAAVPVRTVQSTLARLDAPVSLPVRIPEGALPGRGGVQVLLSARLGADLPGVREYMEQYPYTCLEQRASKAIALRDRAAWDALMGGLATYLDGDGLLKYFPSLDSGSDTLTAYLLAVADEAGYDIPAALKGRMQEALAHFVQGRLTRASALPAADLALRKLAALEALSRSGNVRAPMLDSIALEPERWPTSALLDWYGVLQRTPALPQRDSALRRAEDLLRARVNWQGGTVGFSSARGDALWWLMVSIDANANRLLLAMLDNARWQGDMGRLARGVLARQQRGHWDTTVANAWGALALEKFSQRFEKEAVGGRTQVALGAADEVVDWSDARRAGAGEMVLAWPAQPAALSLRHAGAGAPWAQVDSRAAIALQQPLSSGYRIERTLLPVTQKQRGVWSVGDVYRVRLTLEAQTDMTWVVVADPIPGGASVLGGGPGSDSAIMTRGERRQDPVQPAFEERGFDAYRAYYPFVPKGRWSVEYSVRLNNPGEFSLPPTRVEALYAPELFGEMPNAALRVAQ